MLFLMSEVFLYLSEVPLYLSSPDDPTLASLSPCLSSPPLPGYLARKKQRPPRTLLSDYALGPMEARGGGLFFMSEVPLYLDVPLDPTL